MINKEKKIRKFKLPGTISLTFFLTLSFVFNGCSQSEKNLTESKREVAVKTEGLRAREAAVAGLFYPKSANALTEIIDTYLKTAPDLKLTDLRALICPHAGYIYSGPVAAYGYKQLIGKDFKTVIILAPSHYAWFKGASVCMADVYRTPLGEVPISPKAKEIAKRPPFIPESPARVQRPGWAYESSRPLPEFQADTPHTWEHSDEVQVPFLQRVLKNFEIIPIIVGEVDPEEAAKALNPFIDDKTLIIASSDLSHYLPYESAKAIDNKCIKTICSMDLRKIESEEACGRVPIAILMHIAALRDWKPQLLDYRNSGDTAGDKRGVVGYAAIAFTGKAQSNPQQTTAEKSAYTDGQKKFLLSLARETIKAASAKKPLPNIDESKLSPVLKEKKACFVTLTKNGHLRGCIGHIYPVEPLYKAVIENAQAAAIFDARFTPVRPSEVDQIEIEISILTEPQPLLYDSVDDLLAKLRPGIDGVILNVDDRRSTFLPQVWEQLPDKVDFLNNLSLKAGALPDAWRKPSTKVYTYQVEKFKESDFKD